ncbi:bifunctional methylenetetrahydrofolate dehydrogenase/methenyltetrahydrofolate cyclohydrolase FolD [Arthrobacter sp. CAU 1506]|uniref:bifunctional methylenetetrahydrofolate dehydrogenase/methenyltetrahydrofolate cyclohydrolase FolD n=1 Tax=Arthrobacter sp. CAU 1506 TaxID=2560052 RepID=UPI0010AB9C8A|nr:bifunctional methylenetetrahydrofolate dehydrogenase/methenyltetrahydrofolate cyclohydrolase FolD [Arthrobacter sp. CAU 1506]TJY66113.1 bifunctional methylenetetrahydrofolate dehydrogenase/methenyltetrahydrofolate cyclohydrolase FolD [Arthrobacter sp. CAU 1506]
MGARILDGRQVAQSRRDRLEKDIANYKSMTGTVPGLATVLVGDDPASEVYVGNKRKASTQAGIRDFHRRLPAGASQAEVKAVLADLAAESDVSGILLQLPLPAGLDPTPLLEVIPAEKDVDGLTAASVALLTQGLPGLRPCTPSGVIALLDATGVEMEGKQAVVVGRSELVGRPLAQLLLQRHATVTIAHSRTTDLPGITCGADILVVAAGVPGLIGAEHVKKDAIVIDVGIHRTRGGLVGDVKFDEVEEIASWITPVPGGVGPMTITMLLENTFTAHKMQKEATVGIAASPMVSHHE